MSEDKIVYLKRDDLFHKHKGTAALAVTVVASLALLIALLLGQLP